MAELVEIKGLEELEKTLMALPVTLAQKRKAVEKMAKAGAMVIKKAAQARVKVKSGRLKKAIRIKLEKKFRSIQTAQKLTGLYVVGIGLTKGQKKLARHGHLVEFGTKPHLIKPKSKKAMKLSPGWAQGSTRAGSSVGGGGFAQVVHHPGSAAQPFLGPAFDESIGAATKAMSAALEKEIEKLSMH